MSYRRGELIPDAETAIWMVQAGRHMMHGTCVLAACQVATWTAQKIIEAVKGKRLFAVVSTS